MKFDADVVMPDGATDPDPIASPGTVPDARVIRLPFSTDFRRFGKRLLLSLDAATAETVTIDVYTADDDTFPLAVANRKWYEVATSQTIAHRQFTEITAKVPPGGYMYFRMTADAMAADGILKVALAE